MKEKEVIEKINSLLIEFGRRVKEFESVKSVKINVWLDNGLNYEYCSISDEERK